MKPSTNAFLLAGLTGLLGVGLPAAGVAQPPEAPPGVELRPPTYGPNERWDSMPEIFRELRAIIAESPNAQLVATAAERLWQAHHMSGLVVLPTPGVPETVAMHAEHVRELAASVQVLARALGRPGVGAEAGGALLDVKLNLEAEIDAVQTVGKWTATVRPGTPEADVLHRRQLRRPFIPFPFGTGGPEEVVTHDVIGVNECMVVVKEIQGLKARLVVIRLPIWVEPWFARRAIVGFRPVWIWEYVPAQFIKRIVTCNDCCNKIRPEVSTEIVEHPELLDFWRFFDKGHKVWKPDRD